MRLLSLLLLLLFVWNLNAQPSINIDSCRQVVFAEKDPMKRTQLIIATMRQISFLDSATYWDVANWLVDLAEETGQERFRARAYLAQGFVLEQAGHPQKSINRLLDAAEIYKQQIVETNKNLFKRGLGSTYAMISNSYLNLNEHVMCLEYLEMSHTIFRGLKDTMNIGRCYISYGSFYQIVGQNDKAIKYFTDALYFFSRFEDIANSNIAKLNIIAILIRQKKFDRAEKHLNECLEMVDSPDYPIMGNKGDTYYIAVELYKAKGSLARANEFLDKIIKLYEKNNHNRKIAEAYITKGDLSMETGNLTEAKLFLDKAKAIIRIVPQLSVTYGYKSQMVRYYTKVGEFENAKKISDEVQAYYKNNANMNSYASSFLYLANLYKKQGNANGVFESMNKYIAIQDSIASEKAMINQELFEVQYETNKKEQSILLLSEQKKVQENRNLLLLALLSLLLIAGGAVYYRQQLNEQFRLQSMRSQIASDLHDEIGSSLARLSMIIGSIDISDSAKGYLQKGNEILAGSILKIRDVVWAIDAQNDTFGDLLDRMEDFAHDMLASKEVTFKLNTEEVDRKKIIPPLLRQNFYLFFREAITNISKHSTADRVIINFSRKGKTLELYIKDNGKDLNDKKVAGSGISNMKLRAKKIKGQFDFAKEEQGFMVKLRAPIG